MGIGKIKTTSFINSQLSTINRSRAPDARTTTLNRSTINRSRAPDARTTTLNSQSIASGDARTITLNSQLSTIHSYSCK
ncbi:MAG: hypothetical protein ACRC62_19100 [Microcoleus sp.]